MGVFVYYICLDLDLIKLNGFSGFDQREQKDVYVKLPGKFCGLINNSIVLYTLGFMPIQIQLYNGPILRGSFKQFQIGIRKSK